MLSTFRKIGENVARLHGAEVLHFSGNVCFHECPITPLLPDTLPGRPYRLDADLEFLEKCLISLVQLGGLETPTSCSTFRRFNQRSYNCIRCRGPKRPPK